MIVPGTTSSADFPTTADGFDTTYKGAGDVFYSRLTPDLTGLQYSTLVGGSDADHAYDLLLLGADIYLHGYSKSSDFPTSSRAYDDTLDGVNDGFITRLGEQALFTIQNGIIYNNSRQYKDKFIIRLINMADLPDSIVDLENKNVHVTVGPYSIDIAGDEFSPMGKSKSKYYTRSKVPGEGTVIVKIYPEKERADLNCKNICIDGIDNPITVIFEIGDSKWVHSDDWQVLPKAKGIKYQTKN